MNKTKRILSTIAAVLLSAAVSKSAFAADYYASDESGKASVPEYIESIKVSTEGVDISKANEKNTYELTPGIRQGTVLGIRQGTVLCLIGFLCRAFR